MAVQPEDDDDVDASLFSIDLAFLGAAALVGAGTGLAVAAFKTSIAGVASTFYAGDAAAMPFPDRIGPVVLVPAMGGLVVGCLRIASARNQRRTA